MEEKLKALVLIDYENLYMVGMNKGLELTDEGLEYLISYLKSTYLIEDGMIYVVCKYRDFKPTLRNFVESLSLVAVDAIDQGSDVADGYLIVEGVQQLIENQEKINEVVIIGGDNVYAGFIRKAVSSFRKSVRVMSWKDSLAESLTKINKSRVHIQFIEDVFQVGTGNEIKEGWFISNQCSDLEFAVISFVARSKYSNGYHLNTLANKMVESSDTRVQCLNDYHETREWLLSRTGEKEIFIMERSYNKDRTKKGIVLKLNTSNAKVQYVLNKIAGSAVPNNK